mgnify:FL=1
MTQKDWRAIFEEQFSKLEMLGVKAANKIHKGFVNCVLLFIAWNMYSFAVNYNNYWRLRRDPNLPRQWLEEQTRPGEADWKVEQERHGRESRIQERKADPANGKFYN